MRVTDAYTQSRQLMDHFGLFDWQLKMDMATRRAGLCDHGKKLIQLSVNMVKLNEFHEVQKTVRHEVAHALVGPGHGHDLYWERMAIECGADPVACFDIDVKKMPEGRYHALCGCGKLHTKIRKPLGHRCYSCGRCGGELRFQDVKAELAAERGE